MPPAAARHEVRRLIHVLHAAGDRDVGATQQDFLRHRHNRLRPRAANTVHGHGGDRHWQAGLNHRLTGGIHLHARLNHVAHRRRLDLLRLEASAIDRGADRDGAEFRRRHLLQRSAKGADRGANGLRNNN